MKTSTLIEAVGYLGSSLVLVSFLMVSVVKLRIVNSIGSIIFTVYAFIIHSYPTAIMNLCLVFINIYYLVKLRNTSVEYELIKVNKDESLVKYALSRYGEDIKKCFPGISMDFAGADSGYVICHQGRIVGIMIGELRDGVMEILLDYTIPEFRDFSIGNFLISKLRGEGVRTLVYRGSDENHKTYLSKMGFVQRNGYYEKIL